MIDDRVRRGGAAKVVIAALAIAASALSPAAGHGRDEAPNLVPLPAFDVVVGRADHGRGPALRFSVSVANRGDVAFDLFGSPEADGSARALQCTDWIEKVCTARSDVGAFQWHRDHGHFHLQDFAEYELRRVDRGGRPVPGRGGLVATSGKVSFCIFDTERDRPSEGPADDVPNPLYSSCTMGTGTQGISPGWRDTYGFLLPGQQFLLDDVRDGRYAVVVHLDPENRFFQSTPEDDSSWTVVDITTDPKGRRHVRLRPPLSPRG